MWLYSIDELKEFIKQKCIVNGHGTKYWKGQLKIQQQQVNKIKMESANGE